MPINIEFLTPKVLALSRLYRKIFVLSHKQRLLISFAQVPLFGRHRAYVAAEISHCRRGTRGFGVTIKSLI